MASVAPEGAIATLDDDLGFIALVDRMQQDHALKVVNSARISYSNQSEEMGERDTKLAKYLWTHGHTSPYRHSFYTFHWKAPLFVFRQAFKYQVGSIAEASTVKRLWLTIRWTGRTGISQYL